MSDEFTEHVLKIIIAKVAMTKGFSTMSETALDILTETVIQYVKKVASETNKITTHCGRIDSNGFDVFNALNSTSSDSPATLCNFIQKEQVPPFEFFIEKYPLPRLSQFFTYQISRADGQKKNIKARPFRTHVPIKSNAEGTKSHIPEFYPDMPKGYTANSGKMIPEPQSNEDDKRSDDQNKLKKEIDALSSSSSDAKRQQVIEFDSALTKLLSDELVMKPTDLLESPAYVLDGERPNIDPENLPMTKIEVQSLPASEQSNKDNTGYIAILNIKHDAEKLGKVNQNNATAHVSDKGDA